MTTDEILALAQGVVQSWDWATEVSWPKPERLDVQVKDIKQLLPIIVGLRVKRLGYLSAIVGVDLGAQANEMEVLYFFCPENAIIALRVRVPRQGGTLPSLCDVIPSAEVFERELREMFGIEITGMHTYDHLYLPDGWPEGVYPLRRDFEPAAISDLGGKV